MAALFCGVRAAAAVCDAAIYGSQAVRSMGAFCAPLRSMAASTSSMESRAGGCPVRFSEIRAAPRGPTDCYRSASAAAGLVSNDGPGPRPESQMQRLHKALPRRAQRCPAGARSACVRRADPWSSAATCAVHSSHGAWCMAPRLAHHNPCTRPEGRQHLPDALSEKSRRLRFPGGRHGSPLQR